MKDNDIIQNIKNGNIEQYSLLMDKYHNEIFKFVYNLIGNYETTEDLLQEIFLKVYNHLLSYNDKKSSFRTWLYRISNNHALNYLKSKNYKNSNAITEFEEYQKPSTIDIEKEIIEDDQINQIKSIIFQILKPKHQKIMMLYYFGNLEVKEISAVLDIPEKTIYHALKSSIQKIKKEVM